MVKAGFGRQDITPRLGVEMSGFGPYLHRTARELRDRLYARALAVDSGGERWVLVSCDLVGVDAATVADARRLIGQETGLSDQQTMIHCTHTHSGPATLDLAGWGERDRPYMVRLPRLIANAAVSAIRDLSSARLFYAEVPAEHIAYNRDSEGRPGFPEAMREDWVPRHPQAVEPRASVLRVEREGRTIGFLSSFSCHPVVCCESTHSLHGDFVGVATNLVEDELPGAVGIFLQGCHGDINVAVCHQPQDLSLWGLNTMAARYVRVVRQGLREAAPLRSETVRTLLRRHSFRRAPLTREQLLAEIESHRRTVVAADEGDAAQEARMSTVYLTGMERALAEMDAAAEIPQEVHVLRLGELVLVGTPFEMYIDIKRRLVREAGHSPLLLLSVTNGYAGYAVTEERYHDAPYGSRMVPYIVGSRPFAEDLETQIVDACRELIEAVKA